MRCEGTIIILFDFNGKQMVIVEKCKFIALLQLAKVMHGINQTLRLKRETRSHGDGLQSL